MRNSLVGKVLALIVEAIKGWIPRNNSFENLDLMAQACHPTAEEADTGRSVEHPDHQTGELQARGRPCFKRKGRWNLKNDM